MNLTNKIPESYKENFEGFIFYMMIIIYSNKYSFFTPLHINFIKEYIIYKRNISKFIKYTVYKKEIEEIKEIEGKVKIEEHEIISKIKNDPFYDELIDSKNMKEIIKTYPSYTTRVISMNDIYKSKYMKYKLKYLTLKYNKEMNIIRYND